MRYVWIMARGLMGAVSAAEATELEVATSGRSRRMAALLRVVSEATAELANELDRGGESVPDEPKRRVRRARSRRVVPPDHVSDIDVQAARRALRRAGL